MSDVQHTKCLNLFWYIKYIVTKLIFQTVRRLPNYN